MNLTAEELDTIHAALIMRERILREDWIPSWSNDSNRVAELQKQLDSIPALRSKVCCAKLSLELGFEVGPFVDA